LQHRGVSELQINQGELEMPSVNKVRPAIWNNESIIDLYDDGTYSAIWGSREGQPRSLGVRWNGDESYVGYPNQGRNPVWYSEPAFLELPILMALLEKAELLSGHPRKDEFVANILTALGECRIKPTYNGSQFTDSKGFA
jgi:hypothetical protein